MNRCETRHRKPTWTPCKETSKSFVKCSWRSSHIFREKRGIIIHVKQVFFFGVFHAIPGLFVFLVFLFVWAWISADGGNCLYQSNQATSKRPRKSTFRITYVADFGMLKQEPLSVMWGCITWVFLLGVFFGVFFSHEHCAVKAFHGSDGCCVCLRTWNT